MDRATSVRPLSRFERRLKRLLGIKVRALQRSIGCDPLLPVIERVNGDVLIVTKLGQRDVRSLKSRDAFGPFEELG